MCKFTYSLNTSFAASLRVRATVQSLEGEGSRGAQIGTVLPEESLERSGERLASLHHARKLTLRSALLAYCSMKPLTARPLVFEVARVVGMP